MPPIRSFIESHFGLILIIACAIGLTMPGLQSVPDDSASVALAILTYASCFKLRDGGFAEINWREVSYFYIVRYLLLPVVLFFIAHLIVPSLALGVFLLALVPAAVSSPAFAHMFGGRVPPAFAIVIMSTCLAPFVIPLQFYWASNLSVPISPWHLFKTLVFCIFVPMAAYAATKHFKHWGERMYTHVKVISIVLVAFVIALVIAKQRAVILADIPGLFVPFALCLGCYGVFILTGLGVARKSAPDSKITYAVCSGFNNVALGVSLALLHFPPPVILFVAVSEMAWSLLPIAMKQLSRRI